MDGDTNTTAQAGGEYSWTYEVDLIQPANIARVAVTFGKDYATHFQVQLSGDYEKWQTVAEVKDHDGSQWSGKFAPVAARYVRVRALKPNGPKQPGGQMSVAELEVYE